MEITTDILNWALSNGPLGIVTLVAIFLGVLVWTERRKTDSSIPEVSDVKELIKDYEQLSKDYHETAVTLARTMERLAVLLDERTRRQNGGNGSR